MLNEAVVARVTALVGAPLIQHALLDGSDRWTVVRATAGDQSLVIKHLVSFEEHGHGFASELAALQFFAGDPAVAALVPRLVAHDTELGFVVLEDLGVHPSLADVLLANDTDDARRRMREFAALLGTIAARSHTRVGEFERGAGHPTHFAIWQGRKRSPELELPDAVAQQLEDIRQQLEHASDWFTVGPADACPDNVLVTPEGLRLLDFEGAAVYHALFDAASLSFPFPSCWCHDAVAPELYAELLDVHRAALGDLAHDDYDEQLALVTVAWGVWVLGRWLPGMRREELERAVPGVASGRQRVRIAMRALTRAATGPLHRWATDLDAELTAAWGDASTPDAYPAFQ